MASKIITPFKFYNHLPAGFDLFTHEPLSKEVWGQKYRWGAGEEKNFADTASRVVRGVYANDLEGDYSREAFEAMRMGLWMPGGRIIAGAGTNKHVTLMNCYVNGTLEDSMEGIASGYRNVMLTMQQGGGIGTDFSPLRPDGAWLSRTQAPASGPIPFAKAQDSIGLCVESAGERRGAQMGTLADTHPDLPAFIRAKHTPGILTQFNLSILISDAFMGAVHEDEDWYLYHETPPLKRSPELEALDFEDDETGKRQYVYSVWKAKDLWKLITESTYEYSEPGVIFIDRVNDLNNLSYCEAIRCTNPCGEQPLPPHGTCNLGAVNLAIMVRNPFTDDAEFDWELLKNTVRVGVRFLDNVIDVTNYPLPEQEAEEKSKRRIGLGFSGLASAIAQLGLRYGSNRSAAFAEEVTKKIAEWAYWSSWQLAEERGAFPLYKQDEFWGNGGFAATKMRHCAFYGKPLRNGVLMTIAPTGTTSITYGNIESGLEPAFAYSYTRNLTQRDGSKKAIQCSVFTAHLWRHLNGDDPFPRYFVEASQLKVHEHITIQEACQQWIDASISKTINIPVEMPYEEFVTVYDMAYEAGLKGCTTYRPSAIRGSVLSTGAEAGTTAMAAKGMATAPGTVKRPDYLDGSTAKLRWPSMNAAAYVTLNRLEDGHPFEVFLSSKDQRNNEWMTTATLLMSWLFKLGVPLETIAEELKKVSSIEGYIVDGSYRPSFVSLVGSKLLDMDKRFLGIAQDLNVPITYQQLPQGAASFANQKRCPNCRSPKLRSKEGCETCDDCGYNKCS